jgi:uncharacterized lipoprotein YddW (UPF0748 family)
MKNKLIAFILIAILVLSTQTQIAFADINRNDMRAVWIATILNLDYPSVKSDERAQKEEYIAMLDKLQSAGINTVMFQVRPKADAFYESMINPWSESLTGVQGKDPGYDPMAFMIAETHKRGMSFHAWLNPYRVTTNTTDILTLSSNHPARLHPEWLIVYNGSLYYNPESNGVKEHIVDTVKEIVQNYDVDGIHFDDYFYPSNYPLPDGETKDGLIANERRDNVNEMVKLVYNTIKSINPDVLFGISPMGIWKNSTSDSTGSNTNGNEAYYSVYSDCRAWIKACTIDYIVPQIYWEIGFAPADYETLVKWWSNEVINSNVSLYIGQAAYRAQVASQMDRQLLINQKYSNVKGSVYFRATDIVANREGISDKLKAFYSLKKITALPSTHKVMIDGQVQVFDAYNINGSNYFKLRDIAAKLSGSQSQFDVTWDPIFEVINLRTKFPYIHVGGELSAGDGTNKDATMTTATLMLNRELTFAAAYNINNNNYYKLRDLGSLLGFTVNWNPVSETITIN